jgi:hypothetical protein
MNVPHLVLLAAFGNGHMNGGWGILAIIAMAAMMGGMGWMMFSMMRGRASTPEDPVELLNARYTAANSRPKSSHNTCGR